MRDGSFRCIHDVQTLIEGQILLRFEIVDGFGVTHIVSSDGNVDDENLKLVWSEMRRKGAHPLEVELIDLLAKIPVSERERIWEKHAYSWAQS